jgi:hypothetical protein
MLLSNPILNPTTQNPSTAVTEAQHNTVTAFKTTPAPTPITLLHLHTKEEEADLPTTEEIVDNPMMIPATPNTIILTIIEIEMAEGVITEVMIVAIVENNDSSTTMATEMVVVVVVAIVVAIKTIKIDGVFTEEMVDIQEEEESGLVVVWVVVWVVVEVIQDIVQEANTNNKEKEEEDDDNNIGYTMTPLPLLLFQV